MGKGSVVGVAVLLAALLVLSPIGDRGGVKVATARICESQSHGFKGTCLSNHNCGVLCKSEGFTDGWCRGFRHRCFCTRAC